MFSPIPLLLLLMASVLSLPTDDFQEQLVTYLHPKESLERPAQTLLQSLYARQRVWIFCQRGQPLRLWNVFQSNQLLLEIASDASYKQYRAATARGVYEAHRQRREAYDGKLLAGQRPLRQIELPAHAHSCYGLHTDEAYTLTLLELPCDEERLAQFLLGLALYAAAPFLGESLFCCYGTAAALGAYFARLGVVCVALLCASDARALSLMKLRPLQANFKLVLLQRPSAVALALVIGAWIMQSCCQRCRHLWRYAILRSGHRCLLRLLGYYLIYFASDHAGFGGICVSLLLPWPQLWWLLGWSWRQLLWTQRCLLPPQPRQLLSEEEYEAQVAFETQRALEQLRQRARAEGASWQMVAQLQTPQRFARFLQNDSQMEEEEQQRLEEERLRRLARSSSFNTRGMRCRQAQRERVEQLAGIRPHEPPPPSPPPLSPLTLTPSPPPRCFRLQSTPLHLLNAPFTGQQLLAPSSAGSSRRESPVTTARPALLDMGLELPETHSEAPPSASASVRSIFHNSYFVGSTRSLSSLE